MNPQRIIERNQDTEGHSNSGSDPFPLKVPQTTYGRQPKPNRMYQAARTSKGLAVVGFGVVRDRHGQWNKIPLYYRFW